MKRTGYDELTMADTIPLERVDETLWEIPRHGAMRVPGRVYASAAMMDAIRGDPCLEQVRNVATLPGIVGWSIGMPDIHWGYGFPIGKGGPMFYADTVGLKKIVERLDHWHGKTGKEVFKPSALLRRLAYEEAGFTAPKKKAA